MKSFSIYILSNAKAGRFFSVCFLLILFTNICNGQTGNGKLTGKASDAGTNEPLSGVNIAAKGLTNGTSSITDGKYLLTLPPGTYTISFSYSGYQQKDISEVVIKAGQTTFLDIILVKAVKETQGVVVTSTIRRESQSSVYSAQKRSAAASDGISQEAINKTPDNNAGQILKRVTGVNVQDNRFVVVRGLGEQYNQTMLNGAPMTSTETDKNAFAFDLIPSAAIDNITVNKTATPDMPGNFAGGIVQVNTKDFPPNDFFSVTVGGGFSDQTIGKDFYSDKRSNLEILGFAGNKRDLPAGFPTSKSRLPIYALNIQEQFRYARTLKNNLVPINYGASKPNENFQLGYGKTFKFSNKSQFGIVAALSQRKTELIENEISQRDPDINFAFYGNPGKPDLRGLQYYSENMRYKYAVDFGGVLNLAFRFGASKITLKNLYTQVFKNEFIDRPFVLIENFNQNEVEKLRGLSYLTEQKSILNSILAGEHRTGKNNETRLEWNVNATFNRINAPDSRNFLVARDTVQNIYRLNENIESLQSALTSFSKLWSASNDFIYGGAFNLTTPFTIAESKQLIKGGILFQNRERKATGTIIPISGARANSLDSLLSPSNFYPGSARIESAIAAVTGDPGNYNAGSSLLAAYCSMENKIGKMWRVIWGMRVENYQQNVNSYKRTFFDNFQEPELLTNTFAARTTFNFLPSVNLIYSPKASINFRGAYSNTVIRPELKDLAEFLRFNFQTFTLTQGNSQLKSTSIQNIDFKFEWFPSAGEIISFSAFYKSLIDPIEYNRSTNASQQSLIIPVNTGKAFIRGLEGEVRKKLDFIDGAPWLDHVTLFGNGTWIKSRVAASLLNNFIVSSTSEHSLSGQANYIINAGLSILAVKNTLETTISYNRSGDYINELGSSDLTLLNNGKRIPMIPHFRVKGRDLFDLVITQSFLKNKGKVKFNVSNLLNQRYILYQDLNGNGKFDSAVTINKGKRDDNYLSGIDNTVSSIKPQRTFTFSVSYTF